MNFEKHNRVICWFSCGAASAVATKLALSAGHNLPIEIIYQDTGSEHPDNRRFLEECQEWFGQEIKVLKSGKYADIWEVFEKTRYLVGVGGARCTAELKRKVAEDYINHLDDLEVFGYTYEEKHRVDRFIKNNDERAIWPILIDYGLTKADCLAMLNRANIELPVMYKMGYRNNNCIGCVKGGAGYWNKIRKDFPDVFKRMSEVERKLDIAINKKYVNGERIKVFLDELDPNVGNYEEEPSISCGMMCEIAYQNMD